jgi:methylenetetrahydrofolate dehydrogenase (NADP+) / methenyltetrahydrofolate cyclohydrolase
MTVAIQLNGLALAEQKQHNLKKDILAWQKQKGISPKLVIIHLGNNPASMLYIKHKKQSAAALNIKTELLHLPEHCDEATLKQHILNYNQDASCHGIIIQLPLPESIETADILEKLDPKKDVDGLHPLNQGQWFSKQPLLKPCTPKGIMALLEHYKIPLKGKHAVLVGASILTGKPLALWLMQKNCTVTICQKSTSNLSTCIQQADLLIMAPGKRGLVQAKDLKPSACIIDVGIHHLSNGQICGDVDYLELQHHCAAITPVPGGVGPMTVWALMENTFMAAKEHVVQLEAEENKQKSAKPAQANLKNDHEAN